jgi:hypothetical protein
VPTDVRRRTSGPRVRVNVGGQRSAIWLGAWPPSDEVGFRLLGHAMDTRSLHLRTAESAQKTTPQVFTVSPCRYTDSEALTIIGSAFYSPQGTYHRNMMVIDEWMPRWRFSYTASAKSTTTRTASSTQCTKTSKLSPFPARAHWQSEAWIDSGGDLRRRLGNRDSHRTISAAGAVSVIRVRGVRGLDDRKRRDDS